MGKATRVVHRQPSLRDLMPKRQRKFAIRIREQIAEMNDIWCKFSIEPGNQADLEALFNLSHKIAGSGAFFGFQAISDAARELEIDLIDALANADAVPSETTRYATIATRFEPFKTIAGATDKPSRAAI